jgi:uncharacterized membrane protein YeaQ/YmgE (transglycosylase-associated protein family)
MELTSLLMQLFSGAVGGNVAGNMRINLSLGILCNSMAGIVGGLLGGQLLQFLFGTGDPGDSRNLLISVAGGGIGGAIVVTLVCWLTRAQKEES